MYGGKVFLINFELKSPDTTRIRCCFLLLARSGGSAAITISDTLDDRCYFISCVFRKIPNFNSCYLYANEGRTS